MAVSALGEGLAQGLSLPAGAAYQVALRGTAWELRRLDGEGKPAEAALSFRQPLRLQPLDETSTFGVFDVSNGAGYFWAGREHRYYRGALELRPEAAKGVTLVNELGMEAYLLSVVPSEAWAQWPAEALKAQAIAARTDSWRKLGSSADKGYDLCPTVQCAVYRGVTAEDERTTAAVLATTGQVLESGPGRLAPTFYMNNSGGHTQEPREAWKFGEAYPDMAAFDGPADALALGFFPVSPASLLRFVEDQAGEVASWSRRGGGSTWRWVMSYSRAELSRFVRRRHPVGELLSVEPLERSAGGYVHQVRFSGTEGSTIGGSDRIRSAIKGLKSNLFTVETRRDSAGIPLEFIFRGAGWGHGVGMSQTGAAGMAEAGFKAAAILGHYFGGAKVKKRYG
jgi:SpoIID/LytB domain protein